MSADRKLASYRGPRTVITARVSKETVLVLEAAAATRDVSRSALASAVLEEWAQSWADAHLTFTEAALERAFEQGEQPWNL